MIPGDKLSFTVDEFHTGSRVDVFLADELAGEASRATVQGWLKSGNVRLIAPEERSLKPSSKVAEGFVVEALVPEHEPTTLTPYDLPLEFLHVDDHIAVLVKPAGIAVHPGPGHPDKTLCNVLLHHFGENGLSPIGLPERPGIVSRLDLPTHGLMMVARSEKAHHLLVEMYADGRIGKYYRAITSQKPNASQGEIITHIGRSREKRYKMAVVTPGNGREATTLYRLRESWHYQKYTYSYFGIRILTGRTHQIRVHLNHIGCPIVGDPLYSRTAKRYTKFGLLLSSYRLEFTHPITGEEMAFEIDPPESFTEFARKNGNPDLFN